MIHMGDDWIVKGVVVVICATLCAGSPDNCYVCIRERLFLLGVVDAVGLSERRAEIWIWQWCSSIS